MASQALHSRQSALFDLVILSFVLAVICACPKRFKQSISGKVVFAWKVSHTPPHCRYRRFGSTEMELAQPPNSVIVSCTRTELCSPSNPVQNSITLQQVPMELYKPASTTALLREPISFTVSHEGVACKGGILITNDTAHAPEDLFLHRWA
jgi:hypothetical protein